MTTFDFYPAIRYNKNPNEEKIERVNGRIMRRDIKHRGSRYGLCLLMSLLLATGTGSITAFADEPNTQTTNQTSTEAPADPDDQDPETPPTNPVVPPINPNGPNTEQGDPDDIPPTPTPGTWRQDTDGWWFEYTTGGYAKDEWVYIADILGNGNWYLFGKDGYMLTGWQQYDGQWYYLGMSTGKWIDYNAFEENTIKGVDVSYWQNEIDWQAFKDAGFDYAFVRAGYGTSKSHGNKDSFFEKHVDGANAVGIAAGVYYYSTATTVSQAILDARFVIERMQGHTISYPVAIDMEDANTQGKLSKEQNALIAKAFCDEIASAGYTPMIYCNEDWYKNYIDMELLSDYDKWVARFDIRHSDDINVDIWQSSSTTERPDGKNYDSGSRTDFVDVNFGYTDYRPIVTPRTTYIEGYDINSKVFCKDANGIWLFLPDGSYAKSCWQYINDHYYYFDADGYMVTGWLKDGSNYYYLKEDGKMAFDEWVDGCYLSPTGEWDPYKVDPNMPEDEAPAHGPEKSGTWKQSGSKWWFCHDDGTYTTSGWESINSKWYYFDADGWMKTGWLLDGNTWYYLTDSGSMQTGWFDVNGIWYYTNKKGELATSTWVENDYYVNADGAYVAKKTSKGASYLGTWKKSSNKWWYSHPDGSYAKNGWELINDEWYFFDAAGWMLTGWQQDAGTWYYFGDDGAMKSDTWVGDYYLDSTGAWTATK